jgi:hypothetical protein
MTPLCYIAREDRTDAALVRARADANKARLFGETERGRFDEACASPKLSLGRAGG